MFFKSIRLGYEGSLDGEINVMRILQELAAAGAKFQNCVIRVDSGDNRGSVYIDVETDWYDNQGGKAIIDQVIADHVPVPIPPDPKTIEERLEELESHIPSINTSIVEVNEQSMDGDRTLASSIAEIYELI